MVELMPAIRSAVWGGDLLTKGSSSGKVNRARYFLRSGKVNEYAGNRHCRQDERFKKGSRAPAL